MRSPLPPPVRAPLVSPLRSESSTAAAARARARSRSAYAFCVGVATLAPALPAEPNESRERALPAPLPRGPSDERGKAVLRRADWLGDCCGGKDAERRRHSASARAAKRAERREPIRSAASGSSAKGFAAAPSEEESEGDLEKKLAAVESRQPPDEEAAASAAAVGELALRSVRCESLAAAPDLRRVSRATERLDPPAAAAGDALWKRSHSLCAATAEESLDTMAKRFCASSLSRAGSLPPRAAASASRRLGGSAPVVAWWAPARPSCPRQLHRRRPSWSEWRRYRAGRGAVAARSSQGAGRRPSARLGAIATQDSMPRLRSCSTTAKARARRTRPPTWQWTPTSRQMAQWRAMEASARTTRRAREPQTSNLR